MLLLAVSALALSPADPLAVVPAPDLAPLAATDHPADLLLRRAALEEGRASRPALVEAIEIYRQVLAEHPTHPRADDAVFGLGEALRESGAPDDANVEFTRLVKNFPASRRVPDAYVAIGDYWFERNGAFKALMAFQRAAVHRDSPTFGYASWKLAWCYYNVGEYGKAIASAKAAVDDPAVQRAALGDLVRFYADAGELDEAGDYFRSIGREDVLRDALRRLAATYFEQGKFEAAIQTSRRLLAEAPLDARAAEDQGAVIDALVKMGRRAEATTELECLRTMCAAGSPWARANPAAAPAARALLEGHVRGAASW